MKDKGLSAYQIIATKFATLQRGKVLVFTNGDPYRTKR